MNPFSFVNRRLRPALLVLLLANTCFAVPAPDPSTMETVRAEAARGEYELIGTVELWELSRDDSRDVLIVDTRQGWEYRAGHIAGAVSFPMEPTWLARLKSRRALRQLLGPDREKLLVFY